ncbi:hypothetical protein KC345_g10018 [Hortaea werneckii]|nr:hypothetical protein KC345_g10018 [Hortaea werneckii]
MLPAAAVAQAADTFSLAASAGSVKSGENVIITVKGESLTDVYGAELEISYDASKLLYTGYSSSLRGQAFIREPEPDNNINTYPNGNTKSNIDTDTNIESGLNPYPSFRFIVDANARINTVTSSQGIASADIRSEELLAAAGLAEGGPLIIQVNTMADAKEIRFQLQTEDWIRIASAASVNDTIKLQTGWASVSIHVDLLEGLQISDASSLQFIIVKADSAALPLEIRPKVSGAPVYDFSLLLDGKNLTGFNGHIKVELPYVPQSGENSAQIIINHITDNGIFEVVKNGRYNASTGKAEFKPSHFSKYTVNYAPVSFRDMDGYSWANEPVLGLAAREVIKGRSEGHFVPEGQVTRAEFVQMLVNLFGFRSTSADTAFTDVKSDAWYSQAIAAALQAGLIQGKADGSFGVNDRISREDMAVLIYRASKLLGVSAAGNNSGETIVFLDLAKTSVYAREAVNTIQQAGLMNGLTQGYFGPKDSSTRAQAAAVLFRLYQAAE